MKLFGGGGHSPHHSKKGADDPHAVPPSGKDTGAEYAPKPGQKRKPAQQPAPQPGAYPPPQHAQQPAPQPEAHSLVHNGGKEPLTKRQKRNRLAIIIIAVTLALIAVMFAAAAMMMKPPSLAGASKPSAPVRPENDATIHDTENGDEMAVDHGDALDIDMGNRREGVYTVLVCATDIDGTRTDAIMVATLDTKNDTVNVINIPRDLMSSCNRLGDSKKINAAYGTRGGIETTKGDVKKVLGFTPDKYVVVSFDAIAEIIDAIGGVDYEIPWRMKYDDPTQNLHIDFQPGMTHLDGQAAVEFMRWRKNNSGVRTGSSNYTGGDEQRIEKDQEFLKFLAKEVFTITNVPRLPNLAQAVFSNVKTDLTAGEVLWLAWQLYDVKNEDINMMTLPGYGTMSYAGTGTMYSFYFPYRSQVLTMVNEFINPYENPITSIDVVSGPTKGSSKKPAKKDPEEEKPEEPDGGEGENPEGGSPDGTGSTDGAGNTDGAGSTGGTDGSGSTGTEAPSPDGSGGAEGSGSGDGTGSGSDPEAGSDGGETTPSDPVAPVETAPPVEQQIPEGIFAPGVTPEPPAGS